MTRRELFTASFATAAASAIIPELRAQTGSSDSLVAKPLPFNAAKLNGLSEKLLVSHHDNNYAGAVRRLGQVRQMLGGLPKDAPGFQVKSLRMEELIAANATILHEEYFGNLGGDGKASGAIQRAIARDFGSLDNWEQQFRAISTSLGGGSGWAILAFSFRDGKLRNFIAFDHTDNIAFGRPVLVNDMFEHAYHMDYGAAAARYVDAFMNNIQWDECNRRLDQAQKIQAIVGENV